MKIELKDRKLNPLLEREELKARIDYEEATPSKERVLEALASKLSTRKKELMVKSIKPMKGRKSALLKADLSLENQQLKKILQNPIPKAIEEIEKLEKPDLEKLLRLEKEGMNRKGMKEFLKK